MKLIPFDLEKALAGAEVRTRDGRRVTKLRQVESHRYPVRAFCIDLYHWIDWEFSFTKSGEWIAANQASELDLFLVASKPRKTIWTCGTRWPENKFTGKEGV